MATSSLDTLWVVTSHSLVRASAALLAWALSMGEAAATPLSVHLAATPLGTRRISRRPALDGRRCDLGVLDAGGFALLEAGFSRAKNVVNVMMKNLADLSLGSIAFLVRGVRYHVEPVRAGLVETASSSRVTRGAATATRSCCFKPSSAPRQPPSFPAPWRSARVSWPIFCSV